MNKAKTMVFMLAFGLFAGTAFSQQQSTPGPKQEHYGSQTEQPGKNWEQMSEEQREEIGKKIEAVRVMRLTESLKLDEKTVQKFIPAITSLERTRRDLMRDNQRTMRDLKQELSQKTPDQSRLKAAIDKMYQNHQEMVKLREKEFATAKEYLSIEQQARLVIFQQEFMREIRGMLSGSRGGGMGMGMKGGPGMQPGPMNDEPPLGR